MSKLYNSMPMKVPLVNKCCVTVSKLKTYHNFQPPSSLAHTTQPTSYRKQMLATVYLQNEYMQSDRWSEITQCNADNLFPVIGKKQCCKNAQNTSRRSCA